MVSLMRLVLLTWAASFAYGLPTSHGLVLKSRDDLLSSYDYVIVGAGASGLTVANRLSEDNGTTVLVIEAGGFDHGEDSVVIPGFAGYAVGSQYDWNTTYVPNPYLNNRTVPIPQGKIVGGSTKLNRMVFDRGSKADYDNWRDLGNEGWDWDSLLPYFKKNENYTAPNELLVTEYNATHDPSVHGHAGYMKVSYSPFVWPTTKNFVNAIKEIGISISQDQADGSPIGGFYTPHNQDPTTATRSSAREAYYETIKTRSNLHLITGQRVTRIVTNKTGDSVRVTGVEFAANASDTRTTIPVGKEAIMAAGAIFTPQVLQVSGIGDAAYLSTINVSSVVDLPAVGENFQDHILIPTVHTITAPLTASNLSTNLTYAAEARTLYDLNHTGPYASPLGDFLVFVPLVNATADAATAAALHARAVAADPRGSIPADAPAAVAHGYAAQHAALTARLLDTESAVLELLWADGAVVLGLEHPFSRGRVRAAGADVFAGAGPLADPAYLRDPLDVAVLVEGVRLVRRIMAAAAIAGSLAPVVDVVPGADVTSDDDLAAYVRSAATTLYHPAGSCKMGTREDGGVVDGQLRVYGVEGLRIVDASVMPLLPASHTMTTVYAVAEKAADIIRGLV